jgi:hypothetical protein
MLNGQALSPSLTPTPAKPDPIFERIAECRRAVSADTKQHNSDTEAAVERAVEALVTCAPTTVAGFKAMTTFFRQFKPLQQLLRSNSAWLADFLTVLDLAAQGFA